jgi:hypothetical protein
MSSNLTLAEALTKAGAKPSTASNPSSLAFALCSGRLLEAGVFAFSSVPHPFGSKGGGFKSKQTTRGRPLDYFQIGNLRMRPESAALSTIHAEFTR